MSCSNSSTELQGNTSPVTQSVRASKKQISCAKHWCFTFNNPYEGDQPSDLSKVPIVPSFELKFKSKVIKRYIMQLERGESGTIHLQGYLEFTNKSRPSSLNWPKAIHWEKTRDVNAAIEYCKKDDTSLGYQWSAGFAKPIKTIMPEQFYAWQSKCVDMINNTNDREIIWIYESDGNTGKSAFCKYMCVHQNAIILSGKGADMKHGVCSYVDKHGTFPELIILDIPRSCADYVSYTGIEEIKNGCFFSNKYESSMVVGNCPAMLCFSNSMPDTSKMSEDRWTIIEIIDRDFK